MTDPIETAVKATEDLHIDLPTQSFAIAVAAFALYGVHAAGRDSAAKVKQVVRNRKAMKALKADLTVTPQ